MASIRQRGRSWRAEVYVEGVRESDTFRTKREATAWAQAREAELTGGKLPDKTLGDAMNRYAEEVSPQHRGHRWEVVRLAALGKSTIASRLLQRLATPDLASWRDARLKEVAPGTVAREMNLLRSVLRTAWKEWHWIRENPLRDVRPPRAPPSRKRRISEEEVRAILRACDVGDLEAGTALQRTGLAFAFALETAMRAGEILGLTWQDVSEKSVRLATTKNGDERRVPLSRRAREILAALPKDGSRVFDLLPGTRDVLFRQARDLAKVQNLRFHDSRAEAIWRLSKKLDVLELARVIGHRDIKSLMIYYQTSADELADRL